MPETPEYEKMLPPDWQLRSEAKRQSRLKRKAEKAGRVFKSSFKTDLQARVQTSSSGNCISFSPAAIPDEGCEAITAKLNRIFGAWDMQIDDWYSEKVTLGPVQTWEIVVEVSAFKKGQLLKEQP